MGENRGINAKAMLICVDRKRKRVLLQKGMDPKTGARFYRLLGGHMEFFERSDAALRREIMEELHARLGNLKPEGVIENRFEMGGEKGHEIVFVYSGRLLGNDFYKREVLNRDEDGRKTKAYWVPFSEVRKARSRVYPKGVYEKIARLME